MKKHRGSILVGLIICLLIIFSACMKMENESDGDWIKVNLDLKKSRSAVVDTNKSSVDDEENYTYPSILITAVKGTISSVGITTDLSDNYGQMLLSSDNTVSFTLPVGDTVRLVRAHYANDSTLQQILDGSLTPASIGISEPFTLDANTTRKSVQIVMPTISFNLNKDSYVKGVYKVSLTGSKAFDPYYWSSVDTGYLDDDDDGNNYFANFSQYFLENDNKTISFIKTIEYPFPWNGADADNNLGNRPFADDSFPGKQSHSGYYVPTRVTAASPHWVFNDYNDNRFAADGWNWSYPKYSFAYDDTTGYPTSGTMTVWNPTTDAVHTDLNEAIICPNGNQGFIKASTFSPRIDSDYVNYQYNGYSVKDSSGTVQCIFKQTYEGKSTFTEKNETRTRAWYAADGTTLISSPDFEIMGVASAAKWIRTRVFDGNTHTETQTWYNASEDVMGQSVETITFADVPLRHRSTMSTKIYHNISGTLTLVSREDYTYTNNFQTGQTEYTVTGGVDAVHREHATTRDSQGRPISSLVQDADGNSTYQIDYTFDTLGRRASSREFIYVNGVKTPTCYDPEYNGLNFDYAYATDSSGNNVVTFEGYCNYTSGTPGTYQNTPWFKTVRTYNGMGLKISERQYFALTDDGWVLLSQQEWEFASDGTLTKDTYYNVSSGVATLAYYETYEYDENLYITALKKYDASGDIHRCPDCDPADENYYKCEDEPDWPCYEVRHYTYK